MANTDVTYAYAADITKMDETPDGLMVYGKAAGGELDLDEQRCDERWLKTAMPEWMRYGNVREQHSAIAAGVGKELTEQADGWYLKALVVDEGTIRKVKTGVLKGFSVGVKHGKIVKAVNAPKGLINGGTIVEVSLVDRPANPTATMTICKAAGMGLGPVDEEGAVLVEGDIIKSARATAQDVLHGELVAELDEAGDIDAAKQAINQLCDLAIHAATVIKSAAVDEMVPIDDLRDAVDALDSFTETAAGPDYDGIAAAEAQDDLVTKMLARAAAEGYIVKAAGVRSADVGDGGADTVPATLLAAEITKAVAEAKAPLEEQLKAVQADLAKAMAAPVHGGPQLIVAAGPGAPKASEADRLRAIANQPHLNPAVADAYRAAAEREGATV